MDYVKFWIAKDLWNLSVVLAIFAVVVFISFSIWVFDRIKEKATNAAEKWNEIYSDGKEEQNDR